MRSTRKCMPPCNAALAGSDTFLPSPSLRRRHILCAVQRTASGLGDPPSRLPHRKWITKAHLAQGTLYLQFDADSGCLPFGGIPSDGYLAAPAGSVQTILHALLQHPQHLDPLHTPCSPRISPTDIERNCVIGRIERRDYRSGVAQLKQSRKRMSKTHHK